MVFFFSKIFFTKNGWNVVKITHGLKIKDTTSGNSGGFTIADVTRVKKLKADGLVVGLPVAGSI